MPASHCLVRQNPRQDREGTTYGGEKERKIEAEGKNLNHRIQSSNMRQMESKKGHTERICRIACLKGSELDKSVLGKSSCQNTKFPPHTVL